MKGSTILVDKKYTYWLEEALKYSGGTHDLVDIFQGIAERKYQFWPAEKGCLVTEILQFPKKKVCHVFLGAGEMNQLKDMHESVIFWAKKLNCTELTISGRKGWVKALKSHGWKEAQTTIYKEI